MSGSVALLLPAGVFTPPHIGDVHVANWGTDLQALQAQRQELKEAAMGNMQDDIAREVDARRKQLQVISFV